MLRAAMVEPLRSERGEPQTDPEQQEQRPVLLEPRHAQHRRQIHREHDRGRDEEDDEQLLDGAGQLPGIVPHGGARLDPVCLHAHEGDHGKIREHALRERDRSRAVGRQYARHVRQGDQREQHLRRCQQHVHEHVELDRPDLWCLRRFPRRMPHVVFGPSPMPAGFCGCTRVTTRGPE